MPEFIPLSQSELSTTEPAAVRLELRRGEEPATAFVLDGDNILVGTVIGCDVRLSGVDLPPLLCLLTHEPGGLRLRQLALTSTLAVNGRPGGDRLLEPGDRISFGEFSAELQFNPRERTTDESRPTPDAHRQMLEDGLRRLAAAQKQLEDDRRDWEQDAEKQAEELATKSRKLLVDAEALAKQREALGLGTAGGYAQTGASVEELRRKLEDYRDELYERYQKRRDHLLALQASVQRAARNVQEDKRTLQTELELARAEARTIVEREQQLAVRADELENARATLSEQHRLIEDWQKETERDYATRSAEVAAGEKRQARERERLAGLHAQYQSDLTRLDRLQVDLEGREHVCAGRASQLDEQGARLNELRTTVQEQARQVGELEVKQQGQAEALAVREKEQAERQQALDTRAAQLEAQQTTLVALRRKLEQLQADVSQRAGQLTEQRLRQDRLESTLQDFQHRVQEQTATLQRQQVVWNAQKSQLEEKCAALEAHDIQVCEDARRLEALSHELAGRSEALGESQRVQAQSAQFLRRRTDRLKKIRRRLYEQHDAVRTTEQQLREKDQANATLVNKLATRSEALAEREQQLAEQCRQTQELTKLWHERHASLEAQITVTETTIAGKKSELAHRETELARRESAVQQQLKEISADTATLEVDRQAVQRERQEVEARCREALTQRERLQLESRSLQQQLPELIQQAQGSLDRLGKARGQLRDHLGEVHTYAQQCHAEFQAAQRDLASQAEHLREQHAQLTRAQDDHRLAASSFRQHVSEWKDQFAALRPSGSHSLPPTQEEAEPQTLPMEPLRIIEELRRTPLETAYRVFDTRRGEEALLRRLGPKVPEQRQIEFRERFSRAAAVRHVNLSATFEAREMDGCPAVLQEWIVGVPSGEWREAAAVPAVWLRLMRQAAAGLQAAHEAGLTHGHLHAGRLLLNEQGELKICGLGEPEWLFLDLPKTEPAPLERRVGSDLQALGRIAKSWLAAKKSTPRDEALNVVLDRLLSDDPAKRYPSAQALGEHLGRVQVPDNEIAWAEFLAGIGQQLRGEAPEQRLSA